MRISRARLRRMIRRETVGVDVGAALHLVGVLLRYLGPTLLVPVPIALWDGESAWPFVFASLGDAPAASSWCSVTVLR